MTIIRHGGSPAVCPTGTSDARHGAPWAGRPGVACWVQNQNQNQTVVTTACSSFLVTKSIHRHSVKASRADAWMAADAAIGGGR